ncbi:MAG TPA: hypothetical protein VE865_00855 [Bradyrhizobium sp.]|nr:hypothetical protein [Bradyrhizobium sp.]
MKGLIAAVTLIALAAPLRIAPAAEAVPQAVHARHHGSHHHILTTRVVDRRPVFGYFGRPVYYIPAPFPLGFDFGFRW